MLLKHKKRYLFSILIASICFASCEKDQDLTPNEPAGSNPTQPVDTTVHEPALSKLDMLSNVWGLYRTYKNGVETSSGDSSKFEFTRGGIFRSKFSSGWTDIGRYYFKSDSSAISVKFIGTSQWIDQELTILTKNELHTTFTSGGNNYLYIYGR